MAENSLQNQPGRGSGRRFRPGQSGNPAGKPKGARSRVTCLAKSLLDGEAEALTRKAVELAFGGDPVTLRLCLERIVPPRRERPVQFPLPALGSANDAAAAMAAITAAVAGGELTPGEAGDLSKLVDSYVRAIEVGDFERRIAALEEKTLAAKLRAECGGSETPPVQGLATLPQR